MTSKTCGKCGETKSIDDFSLQRSLSVDSSKKRRSNCKVCRNKSRVKRIRNVRAWLKQYKRNSSCSKCGYSKETHESFKCRALEFHHHNDDKSFSIGNSVNCGISIKKIEEEIDKCIVLCSRCHMEIHSQ